jgi:hypothetical protein
MLVTRRSFILGLMAVVGCGLGCTSSEPTGMKNLQLGEGPTREITQPQKGANRKPEPDVPPSPKAPPLNR